ncbi:hypothetical protein BH20ACI4_BH20ACI4_20660 [soil metagenome]
MSNTELETRIKTLESELGVLKEKVKKIEKSEKPWWEDHIGIFADDPIYDEAMRLGREYRESQKIDYDDEDE